LPPQDDQPGRRARKREGEGTASPPSPASLIPKKAEKEKAPDRIAILGLISDPAKTKPAAD